MTREPITPAKRCCRSTAVAEAAIVARQQQEKMTHPVVGHREDDMTIHSTRREFLGAAASASSVLLAGAAGIRPARAQYPERGLTLIVPYGAGGGTDITARLLAKDLEPVIGKPVTVENRGGGGGWIGWGALAAARPDGYTMGYLNVPSMFAGYLDPQIGRKERLESFTPIINHVIDYNVWAVKADSPFKTVKDVIDAARKQPNAITVSAFGNGSDDHIAILGIEVETGTKFIVIHSKSTAEAKTQALGGHIQVLGANISEVAQEVKAGQFRMLGVMAPSRSRFLPDAPTFKEQGFNQVWSVTRGIATPANLAKDAQAKLTSALAQVINSKDHQARAEQLSLEPLVIEGDAYRKFLKDNEQATKTLMKW
jgi:tripartite-type tricarboxylate transporter receptor subunit TctC